VIPVQILQHISTYWLDWLFGIIGAGLVAAYKRLSQKVKKQQDESKAVKEGVVAILHDRLYQSCEYFIAKGSIDVSALKNIECLYEAYHKLGGNGTGTTLYEKVKALPIRDD